MRKTFSRDKPKKRVFVLHDIAKEYIMNVLPHLTESQQNSPNRAKNGFCVLNKVKNGPKMS